MDNPILGHNAIRLCEEKGTPLYKVAQVGDPGRRLMLLEAKKIVNIDPELVYAGERLFGKEAVEMAEKLEPRGKLFYTGGEKLEQIDILNGHLLSAGGFPDLVTFEWE